MHVNRKRKRVSLGSDIQHRGGTVSTVKDCLPGEVRELISRTENGEHVELRDTHGALVNLNDVVFVYTHYFKN